MKRSKTISIMRIIAIIVTCTLIISQNSDLIFANTVQDDVLPAVYDYVFLIDTSSSMENETEKGVTRIEQVKDYAIDFVGNISSGSNLVIITFDKDINTIGVWKNIQNSDRNQIIQSIANIKATGNATRLWDSICEGVTQLKSLKSSNGRHFQQLVTYSDGEDTASVNAAETCVGNYLTEYEKGDLRWTHNHFGDVAPIEVDGKPEVDVVVGTPQPFRGLSFQPYLLDLGDLYGTARMTRKKPVSYSGLHMKVCMIA